MSLGDEHDGFGGVGGSGQTRTRLPEGNSGDVYGGARRPVRSSRSLVTVVGVVVLLIAAIAFANRGGGDRTDATPTAGTAAPRGEAGAPTSATGVRPVTAKNGAVPTGFAHDEQGAQSAAANYAVALGSDGMFNTGRRHEIVSAVADASAVQQLQAGFDADYSQGFLEQIGLNEDGSAPAGTTFVSRTIPVGTKVKSYSDATTEIDVWSVGMFGLTGEASTKPVTHGWFTISFKLKWDGTDWKVLSTAQRTGPTPVNGDNPVSGSEEITDAVQEFGGFTYAR
ncbi:hypothetical protein [Streptomyces sp.]|uniref:hypothetical protein n=1 Tax=Streptomyces sp. TaxID=1931 RepID=UPI002810AB21|nr:hypothetical protein [Streptomyces sp.]